MRITAFVFVALVAATSAFAALPPGDHEFSIGERSYILHVPPGLNAPAPVVINLHGGGGNAANQQRFSGMDRVADRERFLVIYPNGTGRMGLLTWNAGTCCGRSAINQVDDVAFIRAVVADVAKRIAIDRTRVYATGMSNGAMMSYRLAAEVPDLVTAIAPVAGSMVLVRFHPTLPVAIMHIHSVDDPRALYNGGLGPPFPMTQSRVEHPPVEQQLAKWIAFDGCPSTPQVMAHLVGKAGTRDAGNTATKLVYGPCKSGATIVLWKLTGSGHVWPGSDKSMERLLGKPTHLFDADEEIWSFFKNAPPRVAK